MIELRGKGVVGGVVFGRLRVLKNGGEAVERRRVDDAQAELDRYERAKKTAIEQLGALYDKALGELGEEGAALFEVHQMMLDDEDYCDSIKNIIIRQEVNAEYAVAATGDNFAKMFAEMEDPYMNARQADVRDVSDRLVNVLLGKTPEGPVFGENTILAAQDLTPSETVQMDKAKILAFVTEKGSANSHTAILARTLGIPAIIQAAGLLSGETGEIDGMEAVVDGETGQIFVEPDEATAAALRAKQEKESRKKAMLAELKGKPNKSRDGREIKVYANIGSLHDLGPALQNDAGGIGLFRTEFIYLESNDYPTEEEQFRVYKTVAETMAGKEVIFRTLDIGADKQAEYFGLPHEENPAMGMRAIRICLTRPALFKTQLRALYRASAFGKIGIMFPMIASVWEIRKAKEIADEVCRELAADGIPVGKDVEIGIMIETPAAAVISDLLAKEVNFFSIGTNDLTQYTLAVDRQNASIDSFCDTRHEAVLRLIGRTAGSAHKEGIWVGICGELAADLSLTETFLRMGIDELSVSPPSVLPLRGKIMASFASRVRAVIFDMDGTMIDSERLSRECWRKSVETFGLAMTDEFYATTIGTGGEVERRLYMEHYGPGFDFDAAHARQDEFAKEYVARRGIPVKKGLLNLLDLLDGLGIKKCVATSTFQKEMEHRLTVAGLFNRFDGFVAGDHVAKGKPDPEIFLKAARLVGEEPAACVALEDSPYGIAAAYGAGMRAVMVPDMVQPDEALMGSVYRVCADLDEAAGVIGGLV